MVAIFLTPISWSAEVVMPGSRWITQVFRSDRSFVQAAGEEIAIAGKASLVLAYGVVERGLDFGVLIDQIALIELALCC